MNTDCDYKRSHLIAKAVVFGIYLLLGVVSIELSSPYVSLFIGTPVWLFGVNTVAYWVERAPQGANHHFWI